MLKASKKPISSPFQTLCTLPTAGDTHTHLHVVDSTYQVAVFFSMHFLLSHLCVVTVGFWLLSIQPPDFFQESMPPALLVHVVLLELTPP